MTRRRWWLAGLLGVGVLVRAALPEIVRRQAETRVSELLHARVQIGDVDLGLLRGAVALEDVALRPAAAPAPGAAPEEEPPVVGWRRFAVDLRWWPLVHKNIQLSSVELDEPRVALDRLADGALNLLAFVPVAAEAMAVDETVKDAAATAPEQPKPWGVGIDHLVLRGGQLQFRDFAVQEQSEPVEVRLPTIDVRDVALAPGLYGGPARAGVDVRVDEGRLRVNTHLWLRDGGVRLATTLRARRMPLRRARLYVPEVGWRELGGELGASLVHRLETTKQNVVSGTVTLDDVAVRVPDVENPVLTWKHLGVDIDALDLQTHQAKVEEVELAGATLVVLLQGGERLPAIARRAKAVAKASAAAATQAGAVATEASAAVAAQVSAVATEPSAAVPAQASTAAPPPPSEPAAPAAPWRWSVGTVRVSDATVHTSSGVGERDVGVALEMHDLAGDGDRPAPLKVDVGMDAARVALEGGARIASPGFDGMLTVTDLPVPDVVGMAGALPPNVLQAGRLGATLRLAAGSAAEPPGDVTAAGSLELAEFTLAGADPQLFSAAFEKLALGVDELRVPGVLAPPGGERKPITVKLARVDLDKPRVQLTRAPEGLVLPSFSSGAPAPPASADRTPSAPAPPPAEPSKSAPAPADVTVGTIAVKDGELRVTDRTVQPFFSGGFKPFAVDVQGFAYPALTMENLKLTATSLTRGRLDVTGHRMPAESRIEVVGKEFALQPFNPYATHYSPYSIASGKLSVTTKATVKGSAYDSTTALSLDGFDLGGKEGDSLFKEQFGISLEVALALLRDIRGRIAFDIPVEGGEHGAKVSVMTVAGQALRHALVNALASPLKLVGAAFGGEGKGATPAPIVFAVGRAEPTEPGAAALDALGELLASRPGIGITLSAAPTESDVRWLHEQALREELSRPQGVFGAIGTLTERGARERVRVALEARAAGKEGALDANDSAKLEEWLAERPKPGEKELRALGAARMERAATAMREGHGIAAERVASTEPVTEPRQGEPVVEFTLGAARTAGS